MILSIIIPAHNEGGIIRQTLKTLQQSLTKLDYEIIVVCDACTDDTEKKVKDIKNVIVVNVNYKAAALTRNAGAKQAKGEYLLFLDADTRIVNHNTIDKSIDLLKNDSKI